MWKIMLSRSMVRKMRIAFLLLLFLFRAGESVLAQSGKSAVTLDDLRTPASPAFVVLGVEPTTVERPMTPKAVGLNLLSAMQGDNILPEEYAISVAPYWLVPHPTLTFDQMYHMSAGQSLLANLSVSLATSRNIAERDTTTSGTSMAVGVRTHLLDGKPSSRLESLRHSLAIWQTLTNIILSVEDLPACTTLAELKKAIDTNFDLLQNDPDILNNPAIPANDRTGDLNRMREILFDDYLADKQADTKEEVDSLLVDLLERFQNPTQTVAQAMQAENKNKIGLIIELSGALAANFPHDSVDLANVTRWGFWITPAFRLEKPLIDFMAVGRFIGDETGVGGGDAFDYGARILYQNGDFAVSGEFVQRDRREADNTQRFMGLVEYRVQDGIILTASFGKDYDRNAGRAGNVISLVGINFGFGKNPLISNLAK